MNAEPPVAEAAAEPSAGAKRDNKWVLVAGYVVTGVLFFGATGLEWPAAVAGLIGAASVRLTYMAIRNSRGATISFFSPWALLLASFFAAFSLAGIHASDREGSNEADRNTCVVGVMQNYDALAQGERRFSRVDMQKFAARYCREAIESGLAADAFARHDELVDLRESIISLMEQGGEIHAL